MNPTITFPPPAPALKLVRPATEKWAATLAEERRRLQEDQEALREREANLREYESRLRALQAEIEAGRAATVPPTAPGTRSTKAAAAQRTITPAPAIEGDSALHSAWEKLHRARELLEAEQTHLRDDRIAMRELEASVKRREEALAAREARLAEREALVVAATAAEKDGMVESAVRLTTAPFKMARAVLRGKK